MSRREVSPEDARDWLAGRPHGDVALWLRSVVLDAEPALGERIARGWGALTLHHPVAGYVCGVFTRPDGVTLVFEHGVELHDPEGLLQGAGRQVRHIEVAAPDEALAEVVAAFTAQAVALRS